MGGVEGLNAKTRRVRGVKACLVQQDVRICFQFVPEDDELRGLSGLGEGWREEG